MSTTEYVEPRTREKFESFAKDIEWGTDVVYSPRALVAFVRKLEDDHEDDIAQLKEDYESENDRIREDLWDLESEMIGAEEDAYERGYDAGYKDGYEDGRGDVLGI